MLDGIFPDWLYEKISNSFLWDYVQEIRIRIGKPIVVCYKGYFKILVDKNNYMVSPIVANADLINYIVSVATKRSLYAYNHQIKQGYITTDSGIRIGLCGTVVYDKKEIATVKNITSLNIRVPHNQKGCSDSIIDLISQNNKVKNTLIISPPGAGKTTLVRDIVFKLSNEKNIGNILVVDERFEIAGEGNCLFDVGSFVDVISGSSKSYAFHEGLKTMNPKVIVCDEVSKEEDVESIIETSRSGVSVIATAHAENVCDLKSKNIFKKTITEKVFERIVVLSKRNGVGTIECVYDENLRGIYIPFMPWK